MPERVGSRLALAFGVERLGSEFAIRLFQQNFDAAFGLFELLLAFAGKGHTFFEQFHRIIERKLRAFEAADHLFQASE